MQSWRLQTFLGRLLAALVVTRASDVERDVPGPVHSPFQLVPIRNDTLLGQAAERLPARAGATPEAAAAAVEKCLRGGAARDLAPFRSRVEAALGKQAARDCVRGAEHFYCEALQDVVDPWPLEAASECSAPPAAEDAAMRMEVERDMALCFVIFMVNESEAVQNLLEFRAPHDTVVVHVDASQPEAFQDMQSWAQEKEGVIVMSKWKVMRAGYSAGASLLDALEAAAGMGRPWEVALFLSGSHFWMRPRSELVRFLFYHRTNFAAVGDGGNPVDRRLFVAMHYELHYECGERLWKVTRIMKNQSTVLLPHYGHANISAVSGQPFVALRRDFVDWLVDGRRRPGSPAWTVLRYTMHLSANVEKMIGSLLLSVAPWCHQTTSFHDMTFAKVFASEQESHHNAKREGMEEGMRSAGYLGVKDIREIRVTRWHVVTQVEPPYGKEKDGKPPRPPQPEGIYRVTSEAERKAMDCENCYLNLVSFDWTKSTPAFVAFARKVDPNLRMLLGTRDALEPKPLWEHSDWPLAERIWEIWAFACTQDRVVRVKRRVCDPRDEQLPCAAEFRITSVAKPAPGSSIAAAPASADGACACPSAITVRERVAVGQGRIFAMQAGVGWDNDMRNFAEPSIVQASAKSLEVAYFPIVRRPYDLAAPVEVQVVLEPPQDSEAEVLETEKVDIRAVPKRGVVSFQLQPDLRPLDLGEWGVDLEVSELRNMAQRPLYAYRRTSDLTQKVISRYFDVSVGECSSERVQVQAPQVARSA